MHVRYRSDVESRCGSSETAATHLYRIAQEALTNVIRHSRASEVTIAWRSSAASCSCASTTTAAASPTCPPDGVGGLGLKIMRYRAQMLGGDLMLETCANGGASVRCSCPLEEPELGALPSRARC